MGETEQAARFSRLAWNGVLVVLCLAVGWYFNLACAGFYRGFVGGFRKGYDAEVSRQAR